MTETPITEIQIHSPHPSLPRERGRVRVVWLFGHWKFRFIWNLGFGNWDLTNNPYSPVGCKIENDVTHLQ